MMPIGICPLTTSEKALRTKISSKRVYKTKKRAGWPWSKSVGKEEELIITAWK